ncbi:late control protein D [Apilactobacillus timberlakei]|uniref:XkdQ/YqbQ family protein n=1 Tax=Apilactobacillus timberlakei TaxID=2008380 RepID=UPI0011281AB1|nr:late control protein D [Apilactobacillus timberlakei]TPR21453.1 late control protein D [Apilactobacillus timberlakei]
MITKFIIKRRTQNQAWNAKSLVTNVKYSNDMNYAAGELTFDLIEVNDGFAIHNGDVVMFEWDSHKIFKGYVFKYDFKQGATYSVTAYDGLRYFKSNDSMVFPTNTLGQRFNTICGYLELPHKVIAMPKHKLKAELSDNKSYFSMLQSGIDSTRRAGDGHYFLRDNCGTIELRKYPHYQLKMIIGDKSLVTDYTLSRSIDQAANIVKVVKSATKKGQKKINTETASGNTIKKWGKLIKIEQNSSKMNAAQMKQHAKNVLKAVNKQTNTLKLTAIGNVYLMAGNSVTVKINDLKQVGIGTKRYLISKATHNFGDAYTVDLEMRV